MKVRLLNVRLAAQAATAVLCVLMAGQASAAYRETSWGALNMSYYNISQYPYEIRGYTKDRSADGYCVYMAAKQAHWGDNYPLSFHGYTRTCTGQIHNWAFGTLYRMDIVELWSENGSRARVWP